MPYYGRYSRELRRLVRVEIDEPVTAPTIDPGPVFKPDIAEQMFGPIHAPTIEPGPVLKPDLPEPMFNPIKQENQRGPLETRALNLNKNKKDRLEAIPFMNLSADRSD